MEDKIKEASMFKIVDMGPVSILEIGMDGSVYYRGKKVESMEELTEILPQLFRELMRQQNELLTSYKKKLAEEIDLILAKTYPVGERPWCVECEQRLLEQVKSIINNT